MSESFQRGSPIVSTSRALPAASYNLTRTLLAQSQSPCAFVPIRNMQYLAIIDKEEIVFIDSLDKRWIAVAWQSFEPQLRNALDDAVPYQAVYYRPDGNQIMKRLQGEFLKALHLLDQRQRPTQQTATVISFPTRSGSGTAET